MTRLSHFLCVLAGTIALANGCFAADAGNVVTVTLPARFQIGQAPSGTTGSATPTASPSATQAMAPAQSQPAAAPSVERSQSTGLPAKYTVVTPTFLGNDHNTLSYIRFFNGQTQTAVTNILVVGNHTGFTYGTAQVSVPVYASPQFSIQDILSAASVNGFTNGDDGYAIYLEDPSNTGNDGFQHVIYNNDNGFFENASMCTYYTNEQYEAINQILINVHTSTLSAYPAYIYIHNTYSQSVNYSVTITAARTGLLIGTVNLQALAPNTSYQVPFSFFEQALNWTPRSDQEHANMIFHGAPGYYAIVGQMIYNQRFGSYVNMTHFCPINHYDPNATN